MVTEPPVSLGQASDDEGKPTLSVKIGEKRHSTPFNLLAVAHIFDLTSGSLPQAALVADALDTRTPIQYRYLSLYKILELEYQVGKKWAKARDLFDRYEEKFKATGLSKQKLLTYVISMRDRCAHISLGSKKSLGITGLRPADVDNVRVMMPIMIDLVSETLIKNYGWGLRQGNGDPAAQRIEPN